MSAERTEPGALVKRVSQDCRVYVSRLDPGNEDGWGVDFFDMTASTFAYFSAGKCSPRADIGQSTGCAAPST